MRPARAALVFSLGFFALAAQTLLFRDFLTAFEGNEIALGAFFTSWFLWIAVGAFAARFVPGLARSIAPMALLYLPAFVLEHYFILHIRGIAGVAAYELFPLGRLIALSALTNAPVSLLTGFLFPLACAWIRDDSPARISIGRVYAAETLGAACGGVLVTLGPRAEFETGSLFLLASLPLCLAVAWTWKNNKFRLLTPAVLIAALAAGIGERWSHMDARAAWERVMPRETYQGCFLTAHGQYLYGARDGQFVVAAAGKPCESLPSEASAAEIAAACLAQQPEAQRILVIGANGLALGGQFLKLPQVQRVVWAHPDPEYPARLVTALPTVLRNSLAHIEICSVDARTFVRSARRSFDLILVNLPGAATLSSIRYYATEFFDELRTALQPNGVAAIRFQGPANVIGPEAALLGASMVKTCSAVFPHSALKPGESSWILVSTGRELSESPATLREQYAAISGSSAIVPPDALWTLYPPDRIAAQREAYTRMAESVPADFLYNRDAQPKALLHALLLMLRQSGVGGTVLIAQTARSVGLWALLGGIVLYIVLRLAYVRPSRCAAAVHSFFDAGVLIFSTGLAGMAVSVMLLFAYQTAHGALYLWIGLLSAIFMLGAFAGSACMQRVLCWRDSEPALLLPFILVSHALFLGLAYWLSAAAPTAVFAALFLLAGVTTGVYFPVAAHRGRTRSDLDTGARLESLDHVGAALGAASAGIVLLPLLGAATTSLFLAALLAVNLPALLRLGVAAPDTDRFDRWRRPFAYALFGLCAFSVSVSLLAAAAAPDTLSLEFRHTARDMAGEAELTAGTLPVSGSEFASFYAFTQDEEARNIFNSFDLAPDITGFGGPIAVALAIDEAGTLFDAKIIRSRETPAYVNMVLPWLNGLSGKNLFADAPFDGVDAVSGATVTSRALLRILEQSGQSIAASKSGTVPSERVFDRDGTVPDFDFVLLVAFLGGAIALRFRPGRWRRRAFLLAALIVLGLWRNLQYSAHHALSLPGPASLIPQWTAAYFLVVLVPVITLFVGNVYCGYVCPFGALQELLGEFRPARFTTDPEKRVWRYGRAVKYVLLAVIVLRFAFSRDLAFLSAEPLTTFFSVARERETLVLTAVLLALSIPYRRFWCRNLCPAGAFLALLNRVRLLRPLSPPVQPRHCDLGVRNAEELDCLRCDRCAYAKK